MIIGTASKLLN